MGDWRVGCVDLGVFCQKSVAQNVGDVDTP